MLRAKFLILPATLLVASLAIAQQSPTIDLPSSKKLSQPAPGAPQRLNSLPLAIALSPDGRYAAILNNGRGTAESKFQQSIAILDLQKNELRDFPDARLKVNARQSYFLGLAFSTDGAKLYASIGSLTDPEGKRQGSLGNGIAVYAFADGQLAPARFIPIPLQNLAPGKRATRVAKDIPAGKAVPYPAGITIVPPRTLANATTSDFLLIANNISDNAVLLDTATGAIAKTFDLSTASTVPSVYPYACVINKVASRAWCSLWNTAQVAELDLVNGNVTRRIEFETSAAPSRSSAHPTAMALSPDERTLFVTLANRDQVGIIDLATGSVRKVSTLLPGQTARGSSPIAIATSPDGQRAYVACADLNAIAVIKTGAAPAVLGYIPTEWYPTALAVHQNELLITTGKAAGTGPNSGPAVEDGSRRAHPYIYSLLHGSVARVNIPDAERSLPALTEIARSANRITDEPVRLNFSNSRRHSRFPWRRSARNPIKHVIYVIKENRTYDQLLGDLGVGDGDPSLTIFGRDITPNHHKLALQFGVLDNFYDSGEVSGDGHVWSTAAITSDYHQKTIQIGYRGRERTYDYEGSNGNEYALQLGTADINEPGTGYLWANAARHRLTYRHYGEFVDTLWCDGSEEWQGSTTTTGTAIVACARKSVRQGEPLPANVGSPRGAASPWPWAIPMIAANVPTKPELVGHFDPNFADFKMEYPDQLRMDEFLNEFDGFVRARKSGDRVKQLPQLVVLRLPNDHTVGTKVGLPTPAATVADNDLALGRLVEAVSGSPYWNDTAILVLEDDAQDGADHVDAHRSLALVISKYSPSSSDKPYVDHRFYTTVNMIRTLEDLLGLPPMNVNDAYAAPIAPLFTGKGTQPAFKADHTNLENRRIYAVNAPDAPGAKESAAMDFTVADRVDTAVLNAIVWKLYKGAAPMPQPKHNVIHE